jgi:hypothetical protein
MRGAKKLSSRSINGHTFATTPSANRDIVRRIGAGLATSPVAQVSGQAADNLFSCCLTSTTTDCISSPPWTLFAKNLNKSAVRRNSFSQFGVKPGLPFGLIGLRTGIVCFTGIVRLSSIVRLMDHGRFFFHDDTWLILDR